MCQSMCQLDQAVRYDCRYTTRQVIAQQRQLGNKNPEDFSTPG
jgi:hypothetical protein